MFELCLRVDDDDGVSASRFKAYLVTNSSGLLTDSNRRCGVVDWPPSRPRLPGSGPTVGSDTYSHGPPSQIEGREFTELEVVQGFQRPGVGHGPSGLCLDWVLACLRIDFLLKL